MKYSVEKIEFTSHSKLTNIKGKIYIPKTENIKGIIQIIHGMTEYFDRYITEINYFLEKGYIVCGHDHLGHGESCSSKEERGFFGEKNGDATLVADAYSVTKYMMEKYPELKYFIIGHSMGSFITRILVAKHPENISGIILSGTGGENPLAKTAIEMANSLIVKKGSHYRSTVLVNLASKYFNASIPKNKTDFDWLTRDEEIIKKRMQDERSDFIFTVSGYRDLFTLVKKSNEISVLKKIKRDLHIGMFSGDKDPVGMNGKSVIKLFQTFEENNFTNVHIKLYKDARHEIFNEVNSDEVREDINKFLENTLEDLEKERKTSITLEEFVIPMLLEKQKLKCSEGDFAMLLKINTEEEKSVYSEKDLELINVMKEDNKNNILDHVAMQSLRDACEKFNNNLERTFLITNKKLCPMCVAACYLAKVPVTYYITENKKQDAEEIINYLADYKGTYALKENKYS